MSGTPEIIPLSNGKYLIPNPAAAKDFSPAITRNVAIEHAGEKISLEVHIHLTQKEIVSLIVPEVLNELNRQLRAEVGPGLMRVEHKGKQVPNAKGVEL